jgi:hypothetical protein
LSDALEQHQYFLENGTMVPRHTSLIYSRGVLFFFVDRRANVIRFNDMQPFNVGRLPTAISGFERLNDREVFYEDEIKIRGDSYKLRSVVLAEVNRNSPESNIVVGSSAIFMLHADGKHFFQNEFFQYDPLGVTDAAVDGTNKLVLREPVSQLYGTPGLGTPNTSFIEMARRRGIIFLYENAMDKPEYEVMY